MAKTTTAPLDSGDAFPPLALDLADGSKRALPDGRWTVVLVYRGEW